MTSVGAVDLYNFPKNVVLNCSLKSKSDILHFGAVDHCNFDFFKVVIFQVFSKELVAPPVAGTTNGLLNL